MNLPDFSVTWAYTRGGLYTGSFGSRGFRGAYTRGGGLIQGGAHSRSSTVSCQDGGSVSRVS